MVLARALVQAREDVRTSTVELSYLRSTLSGKRRPLADRLEALRREVGEMRGEVERTRAWRRQRELAEEALGDQVAALADECRFVFSLLSEYRRSLETRSGVAESTFLAEKLAAVDAVLEERDDHAQLPLAAELLLGMASDWNDRKLGGMSFPGAALSDSGLEHDGRFGSLGPIAYFAADHGPACGIVVSRLGSAQPGIFGALTEESKAAIRDFLDGKESKVPVDVTSGQALKVAEARTTLVEHMKKGGVVMIPLLCVGAIAAALALWKLVELGRIPVRPAGTVQDILSSLTAGDVRSAAAAAGKLREPLGALLREGIELRNSPREHLEEILHERVLSCVPKLERHLGTLAVLGGVAPLLGLLGTVTGMIHTFQLVTIFGTGDAKLLSGGISEALVTTEFGLAIAIPVLLVHAYFSRRVRTVVATLESVAAGFINELKVRGKT